MSLLMKDRNRSLWRSRYLRNPFGFNLHFLGFYWLVGAYGKDEEEKKSESRTGWFHTLRCRWTKAQNLRAPKLLAKCSLRDAFRAVITFKALWSTCYSSATALGPQGQSWNCFKFDSAPLTSRISLSPFRIWSLPQSFRCDSCSVHPHWCLVAPVLLRSLEMKRLSLDESFRTWQCWKLTWSSSHSELRLKPGLRTRIFWLLTQCHFSWKIRMNSKGAY